MAVYRYVHISFWQDEFVLELTPEEKFFYLYLMTNSKTTQCGIYEIPKKVIQFETGYNAETVDKLIQRFVDYGKILYSEDTKEIMLLNWIKYNWSDSPKVIKRITEELKDVKDNTLLDAFDSLCKQYGYSIDTESQIKIKEKEKEKEKHKEKKDTAGKPQQFTPPTIEEVRAYCLERKNGVDPQKWYDFYSAKGWMIGRNKMKNWQAAVRTWEREEKQKSQSQRPTSTSNLSPVEQAREILRRKYANDSR